MDNDNSEQWSTDDSIEQWFTNHKIDSPIMRDKIRRIFSSLAKEDRLDLATVDIKTACKIEKFEHAYSETPELFETIAVDFEGDRTIETFPTEGHP